MKLIDKDALVAEIEKKIMQYEVAFNNPSFASYEACLIAKGKYRELLDILQFINALEVKEVKEDPVSNNMEEAIGQSFIYHENRGDDFRSDKQIETAYRYGFETGFKYKESIIEDIEKQNLEVKEVNLEKEVHKFIDKEELHLRLWDVDRIAKHFFELGLKAQKGE